ncbi:phosphotransferase family enzyme [Nocardia tenerifensis]|uniref:Phosphotransferase family enzyme n=1 Tax=Nocardia tenerifensis TaxID=228006 RepID=A0A318L126_9NOCA|nr:phosphotransferase [Nocardia tenerifensis]PXX71804.1 phosphotransferase family enzyme [Nocardia tenerifensis]
MNPKEPGEQVLTLLAAHGLSDLIWKDLCHDGYSGALLQSATEETGTSWVLKRTAYEQDWIMQATADTHGRETLFARNGPPGTSRARSAAVDGLRTDRYFYTLMRDISPHMPTGPVERTTVELLVAGMLDLHSRQFGPPANSWCSLRDRLLLLSSGVRALRPEHQAYALLGKVTAGWSLFDRIAPKATVDLIRFAHNDIEPLIRALTVLPQRPLHGDMKLANLGVDDDGVVWLIDWALAVRGPACVELGWFIAVNSRRFRIGPHAVLDIYSDAAGLSGPFRRRHEAMTALCGLLLYGWKMSLDARDHGTLGELMWWCDLAIEAGNLL